MRKQIKYIFIVITPFHKLVLTQLFPKLINSNNTLVLISDFVKKDELFCEMVPLKKYEFSRSKLFREPFKYLNKTKKDIVEAKEDINLIKKNHNLSKDLEIFIGTDKDVFTQLLLNDLYKCSRVKKLTVVDEGIGFYVNKSMKDELLSLTYKLLTPIFFRSKLYYIKRLGVYPKIDVIYLRTPELLKSKNNKISYIQFNLNNKIKESSEIPKGKVLLFSFPDQNYNIQKGHKYKIIKEIAFHLNENDRKLIIKPHPRENVNELKAYLSNINNIQILDNNFSGEELDYFDYELIVNFFSSIILDILDRKYPNKRIFTIGFTNKPEISLGENLKYCSINNFSASDFINFENY